MSNNNKSSKANNQNIEILLKNIEEQNDQISRLQSKFRDVTHAYKVLLAEKQALEITLKSFKTKVQPAPPQQQQQTSDAASSAGKSSASDSLESAAQSTSQQHSASESSPSATADNGDSEKIAALTSNIQLLLENKSKMEMGYQAEKKKLKADLEEIRLRLDESRSESEKSKEASETRIRELKAALKQSQLDREKLNQEINSMIRVKQSDQESKLLSMQEESAALVQTLKSENADLKQKAKQINRQLENKCEEMVQYEGEIKALKDNCRKQIAIDEGKINDLREQLKELSRSSERRIGDLEANISQLCATIASQESAATFNSSSNSSSKSPKYAHPSQSSKTTEQQQASNNNNNTQQQNQQRLEFDSAIEQVAQLKAFIESTAQELNIEFDFNDIWLPRRSEKLQYQMEQQKELQAKFDQLKEENRFLRDEYEKYKIRTNYLIKSAKRNSRDVTPGSPELDQVQSKRVREELENAKKKLILNDKERQEEMSRLRAAHDKAIAELHREYKTRLDEVESGRVKSINDIEKELVKQRDRTFKLLAEKDLELDKLRQSLRGGADHSLTNLIGSNSSSSPTKSTSSTPPSEAPTTPTTETNAVASEQQNATMQQQQQQQMHRGLVEEEPRLVHVSQQYAYKDAELSRLRIAKVQLEYKLKQSMDENAVDVERFQAQIELLKQEIERLKLNQSRLELNGANFEYIKNVVYNFMTAKDANIKMNLTLSLMQILKFTKNEKQKLMQAYT